VTRSFPQWAGFERIPKGRLLSQLVDLDGPLGVAYERSVGFFKPDHLHDRHMLVCPRGAAVMDVVANEKRYRVDSRHVLWVPRRTGHADESVTTLYDTLALYPSPALFDATFDDAALGSADRERLDTQYLIVRRSRFFDTLLEHYFFARTVARAATDPFQERQLFGEALRMLAGKRTSVRARAAPEAEDSDDVADAGDKAVRFIEANLFMPTSLDAIARHAGASTSTLLRSFRRTTGQTPYAYIKARRLDEAKHLLEGGKHQVGEVAILVGYDDFGAFSKAFRKQFGRSPREYRP
jgi:AraC-like DNA-binding protein